MSDTEGDKRTFFVLSRDGNDGKSTSKTATTNATSSSSNTTATISRSQSRQLLHSDDLTAAQKNQVMRNVISRLDDSLDEAGRKEEAVESRMIAGRRRRMDEARARRYSTDKTAEVK